MRQVSSLESTPLLCGYSDARSCYAQLGPIATTIISMATARVSEVVLAINTAFDQWEVSGGPAFTNMVRTGTNLRVIQEALGHTSLQTTSACVSLARDLMDQQLQANASWLLEGR